MNRLSLLFARRYLFSRKSHSVINIVSGVSAFAVSIPVAAMVILLSVFNGFENLIQSLYSTFDPDLVITPVQGKTFPEESLPADRLRAIEGVESVSYALEENALFEYRDRQYIGMMKGVDSLYGQVVPMDSIVTQGQYRLRLGDFQEACVGQGVAYALGIRASLNDPMAIYIPRRGNFSPLLPMSIYRRESVYPSGIFALDAESDGQYVFVSLDLAQRLLDLPAQASSIAVKLQPGTSAEVVQARLKAEVGPGFKVLSRYQQNESFYRIMMYEKWGIYFIILLVLVIASFSLVGSLVMLIIEKRKDTRTLVTMGASLSLIRRIFRYEGLLIYGIGSLFGLALGLLLAGLQQHFGWIGMGGSTFLVDAYPVEIRIGDLFWIVVTVGALSWLIATLTVRTKISPETIRPEEHDA